MNGSTFKELRSLIKPLKEYVDVESIFRTIKTISMEDLIAYLMQYDIKVIDIVRVGSTTLYLVEDFESKNRKYVKASDIVLFFYSPGILALRQILRYKPFTEKDLRRILAGIWIHEAYRDAIGFLLPLQTEVKCVNEELGIVGSADIVGPNFVIELKSSSNEMKCHELQLAAYMASLGKPIGFIVYRDKVKELMLSNTLVQELRNIILKILDVYRNPRYYVEVYRDDIERWLGLSVTSLFKYLNTKA